MHMYVAGEWRRGRRVGPVIHPYSGQVIDEVPVADASDTELALAAAVDGAQAMRALSAYDRQAVLRRAADLVDESVADLARTISSETGKPLAEALNEAGRAGEVLRLSAAEGARVHGETVPVDAAPGNDDKFAFTVRQPCGVVVAITPFNYPLLLVVHKVGPALAAGNAVILKPADQTPLTALKLTELLLRAGLPPLGLQCITGPGAQIGEQLCMDQRVRAISFTGSTAVGERITRVAGVKKLSLELGSNASMVVLPNADLDAVARSIVVGGYTNAGQVCLSVQRILVDRSRYADCVDALLPQVERITVGDPFAETTGMSSMISIPAAERVEQMVRGAVDAGGSIATGGSRDGAVMYPTVVTNAPTHSDLWTTEVFGPAVGVTPVDGVDQAIRLVNDSSYGLAAGVFTTDIRTAFRFAREIDTGNIHINSTPLWRADLMPYGGLKGSGVSKEGPRYAVEEMTELKTVVVHNLDPIRRPGSNTAG